MRLEEAEAVIKAPSFPLRRPWDAVINFQSIVLYESVA